MKRRAFLLSAGAASSAMLVGCLSSAPAARLGGGKELTVGPGEVALNGWIKVQPDGSVLLAMPRSEMGQGVHTALPMLVAEELDMPLDRITLVSAGPERLYGNVAMFVASLPIHPRELDAPEPSAGIRLTRWAVGQAAAQLGVNATGGSSSVADAWDTMRLAGATARAALVLAAAETWGVSPDSVVVAAGVLSHPSGRTAHFGELAARAAGKAPRDVKLMLSADWKLIGTSPARRDVPAKVDGSAQFGIDVRLPNQCYAAVQFNPQRGGAVAAVRNEAAIRARAGVLAVVTLPPLSGGTGGVAVVAASWWQAKEAAQQLDVQWATAEGALPNTEAIAEQLRQRARGDAGTTFHSRGDRPADANATVVESEYSAPYLAHATLEPMNATARYTAPDRLELWLPTQVPGLARSAAARATGLDADNITLSTTLLGGGFGRRLDVDVAAQAARIAQVVPGRPVQLVWTREQDFQHDFYRPAQAATLRAWVKDQRVVGLEVQSAGDAVTPRWLARTLPWLAGPVDLPDRSTAEGLFDLPYNMPYQRMRHDATQSGVPVGYWRSVGHSHNAFFTECFVDELAERLKSDPLELRLQLLADSPRHRAVLVRCAQEAGWQTPLPAGRARGLALHASFGSVVAQVVEVSLREGRPFVHRVVCAIDCGQVVHPDIVAQQMEGAVVFGLTAALYGKVVLQEGVVQLGNFPTQPLATLAEAPLVQTHIVASTRSPSGVGEPGVPPVAPALANALYALTGKRNKALPLSLLPTQRL